MKLQTWITLARTRLMCPTPFVATLLCLLAFGRPAVAQNVLAPPPAYSVTPPAVQEIQTNETEVFVPAEPFRPVPQETSPLRWGPLELRPHFLYRLLYGTGIQASPTQSLKTAVHQVAPGFLLGVGRHWTLDYTPTWTFYSKSQFRDTLDHAVVLTGGTAYENWILGLSQSYVSSTAPLVETGGQTSQETFSTAVNASYRFNQEMLLELAAYQNFVFPENFTSSREWSTLDWLDYQFWPRFNAAIGVGFGYVDVSAGSDMTYERYQARINWRATDKISFQLHGGVEDRQFLGTGGGDLVNPTFGASIQYQPFEATKISLNADRVVASTYFQGQVTETTGFTGNLTQRLLKRFYLSLGGGYQTVRYVASASGIAASREDNYYSLNARLSTSFLKRGTIAALYQFSRNSSNTAGFGYSSNQVGLEVGYRF